MRKDTYHIKAIILVLAFMTTYMMPLSAQNTVYYGLTYSGGDSADGTIVRYSPATGTEQVVYSFASHSPDGGQPLGSLTWDPDLGTFYGMTIYGGTKDSGAIFSFSPYSNSEQLMYSFQSGADGQNPNGSMIYQDSLLWGMTQYGGTNHMGVIFSFDPATGRDSVRWSFGSGSDGQSPYGDLVYDANNGLFYGMTAFGGTGNTGALFSFDPSTNTETVLWNFQPATGYQPIGNLVYDISNGLFYGMTSQGGDYNVGVIFNFNPANNIYDTVWHFGGVPSDGDNPRGSLLYMPVDSLFWGMTSSGGVHGGGTIFTFTPWNNNTESPVWSFGAGTDGSQPSGNLVYDPSNNELFGMTERGGSLNEGAIIGYVLGADTEFTVWSFGNGRDASIPYGNLVPYTTPDGIRAINTSNISIYPNPTSGIISMSGLTSGQTVEVYDYLGQKVSSTTADNTTAQINLNAHESDVYLVTVLNADGSVASQKKVVKENF